MIKAEDIEIVVASEKTVKYVDEILDTITRAAKVRGTGIAKRSPEYVKQKMLENKAVVALYKGEEFAGFSYIESWSNKQFVANSGLIVANKFRGLGLANRIKRRIFELSRERFPHAKIFSLTTGAAVMKINNKLGFRHVRPADRRRGILERLRELCEFRHLAAQRPTHVPLHRAALRPRRAS
jgi:hypothetical protein